MPPAPRSPAALSPKSGSHRPTTGRTSHSALTTPRCNSSPAYTLTYHRHTQEWAGVQGTWAVSSQPGQSTKLHALCSLIPPVLVPMKQHMVCVLEQRARTESRSLRPQRLPLARPGPLPTIHTQGLTWSVRCCSRPLETAPRGPAQHPSSLRPGRLPAALCVQGGPVARTQMPGQWGGLRLLGVQPDADDKWPCPPARHAAHPDPRRANTCPRGSQCPEVQ